jgi:hypothetical protein
MDTRNSSSRIRGRIYKPVPGNVFRIVVTATLAWETVVGLPITSTRELPA